MPLANVAGNSVVEDIGGGRYVTYAHLKPGSIPAWVREGARLRPGDLIGRVGNSGNSDAPHLHFQVHGHARRFLTPRGCRSCSTRSCSRARVSEAEAEGSDQGAAVPIDRTGAGVRRGLMPARNGVFGYNLGSGYSGSKTPARTPI